MQITSRGVAQSGIGYRWYLHLANGRSFSGWYETLEEATYELTCCELELLQVEPVNPLNELLP